MAPASSRGQPQSPECLKSRGFSISGGAAQRVRRFVPTTGRTTVGGGRYLRFCLSIPARIAPANRRCYRIPVEQKRNTTGTAPAIDTLLEGLNPAQRRAATYGIGVEGGPVPPLLIAAGAGTGKTKTLAHRVARLILGGADPRRLLLLTFTRRAALEMTRRAQQILVSSRPGRPVRGAETTLLLWSGTFHSTGSRLLRRHAAALSLDPAFTVLARADSADLMDLVRSDLSLARTRSRFPKKGTCLSIYSYTVNAGCPLEDTLTDSYPWCDEWGAELKRLFTAYVAAKQRSNVLDYDDLLLYWREATQVPGVAAQMRADFDHILVDEYQDTNRLQAAILLAMAPEGAGLTVVGDDAQSIYAFRAATVRNILDFPDQFSQRENVSSASPHPTVCRSAVSPPIGKSSPAGRPNPPGVSHLVGYEGTG